MKDEIFLFFLNTYVILTDKKYVYKFSWEILEQETA